MPRVRWKHWHPQARVAALQPLNLVEERVPLLLVEVPPVAGAQTHAVERPGLVALPRHRARNHPVLKKGMRRLEIHMFICLDIDYFR